MISHLKRLMVAVAWVLITAASSPVFNAMLYVKIKESKESEISPENIYYIASWWCGISKF